MFDWVSAWPELIEAILDWLAKTILDVLNQLWDLLAVTAFVSPDVTKLPQVTAFAGTSLGIVNTCYVLAFLWAAILVMGRDTIQSKVGPGELIPRLVIGLIAANFAMPICSGVIGLANALTAALTSQDITSPESLEHLRTTTADALADRDGGSPAVLLLVITLLIAVLTAFLLSQWVIRIGLLIVLVSIAPIALALHGTPQTEGGAKLWWRTFGGTLGTVLAQAEALHVTLSIFLNPDHNITGANLPGLGLPGQLGVTMNLFFVVCLLWTIIKIPGLMGRYVSQGRPSAMGMIVRVLLVQQLSQAVSRALRAGRGAARAAGGRAPRSAGGTGAGGAHRGSPITAGNNGANTTPRPVGPRPARQGSAPTRPLPRPAGAGPGRVGVAYPTGRPVPPYTPAQLAQGVDPYTRAMKARQSPKPNTSRTNP